ncbi:hypothetical protein FS935_01075 [Metabacillus litoralis]|uniref:Uncharacterized protein n=1 Tax=Metabacillus litoralis TaxID=152268 RepID=A0A5C6WAF0_9BACI|nr:CBO0543 family protein [Metabacillus litoralis]TXC92822.1 hypothetical protein FS935_01075 [Metabacillus litoralis]
MKNRLEKMIELSSWIVTSVLLIKLVPHNKIKEAQVSFLFKQVITWIFGLIVVEKKLIRYPYRLFFKTANKASFTFEYFVYPALCSIFNLYYPEKKNNLLKILYYCFHTSIITGFEVFAEKYTNLIHYKKWSWKWSFITIWFTYFLSRIYFKWFFYGSDSSQTNQQQIIRK